MPGGFNEEECHCGKVWRSKKPHPMEDCPDCFPDLHGMDEWEERQRRKIAERNEY